jgi:hypothetical protein
MLNRRWMLGSLAGALVAAPLAQAGNPPHRTKDVWDATEDVPAAKTVRGHPNYLDFGDGLKVPLNKQAFLTLWEGKTFWMTYGVGRAERSYLASPMATAAAEGTMKLLLLTLAFAPERLEHVDGGWRLKVQDVKNYVRGDVELPGKPFSPLADARFGNMDTATPGAVMPTTSIGQSSGGISPILPTDLLGGVNKALLFTCYIVKKKDVDLDYVRRAAQLVAGANERLDPVASHQ